MPKGKRKGKYDHKRTEQASSSEEDMGIDMGDNMSEISGQSDMPSQEDAENDVQEKYEEKLLELIEGLNARAAAARATCMESLRSALQRRPAGHILANHRQTLAEHVSRALRRGRDAERKAAAAIAPLLALQIGDEGIEEYMEEVRPALLATATDRAASLATRTESCSSLAVLCYLLEEDVSQLVLVIKSFETIFSGSYPKGDGSIKVSGEAVEEGVWHAAALDGWALLYPAVRTDPPRTLPLLLSATCSAVRISAAGAIAAVYEQCGEAADHIALDALPALEVLAKESHKYRARRDRKLQRATARDVLRYLQDEEGGGGGGGGVGSVSVSVRIGSESVEMSGWVSRAGYVSLAAALGSGLCALAPTCRPLRAALGLSPAPPPTHTPTHKPNRLQRHLQNAAADKARTVARNKNRDKRSAALAM